MNSRRLSNRTFHSYSLLPPRSLFLLPSSSLPSDPFSFLPSSLLQLPPASLPLFLLPLFPPLFLLTLTPSFLPNFAQLLIVPSLSSSSLPPLFLLTYFSFLPSSLFTSTYSSLPCFLPHPFFLFFFPFFLTHFIIPSLLFALL